MCPRTRYCHKQPTRAMCGAWLGEGQPGLARHAAMQQPTAGLLSVQTVFRRKVLISRKVLIRIACALRRSMRIRIETAT